MKEKIFPDIPSGFVNVAHCLIIRTKHPFCRPPSSSNSSSCSKKSNYFLNRSKHGLSEYPKLQNAGFNRQNSEFRIRTDHEPPHDNFTRSRHRRWQSRVMQLREDGNVQRSETGSKSLEAECQRLEDVQVARLTPRHPPDRSSSPRRLEETENRRGSYPRLEPFPPLLKTRPWISHGCLLYAREL